MSLEPTPSAAIDGAAGGSLRDRLAGFLRDLRNPLSIERRTLCDRRWTTLPERLRTPQQAAGRTHVACGATHGVLERCNFACTACYLTSVANRTPPLPFSEVCDQLDELRRRLGPMGKVQITSGEVTLLDKEELGRIVEYARSLGLDPMVMSNGQRFEEEPDYLPALVRDHGLRKVSIHIDVTQRGRCGVAARVDERSLRPVRDRFANLIRRTRRETARRLDAAHTVTVTEDNIDQLAEILHWALANHDAFRMVSFQPVADIGRTRDRSHPAVSADAVWSKVCDALGRPLNRDALHFGHPACNIVCPLFVVSIGDRHELVECVPHGDQRGLELLGRMLDNIRGLDPLGADVGRAVVRIVSLAARNPGLVVAAIPYGLGRAWGLRRLLGSMVAGLVRLRRVRIRPWSLIVHAFMNRDELETPLGQERLDACVFRVPVDGRLVSMCELNATGLRLQLNRDQGASLQTPRPESTPQGPTPRAATYRNRNE